MLELDEGWMQIYIDKGICLGHTQGSLIMTQVIYDGKLPDMELNEKEEDLLRIKRKYPYLNKKQLAQAVWKESEYWHGTDND